MKENDSHFRDWFCYTMERAGLRMICESVVQINSQLLLYDEADRHGVLMGKKMEIRRQLEQSDYMIYFPFKDIHLDLPGILANYYNKFIFCNAVGLLHRRSITRGRSNWSLIPGILADTSLQLLHCKHTKFDFSTLELFQPIVMHIFLCGFFRELNTMIDQYAKKEPLQSPLSEPHPSPVDAIIVHLFANGGYELFCYLNENYSPGNKCLNTKYSNLYHFLKHENKLLGTQAEFMNFIRMERHVSMSKILPKSFKYDDSVFPLLSRLILNFGKKNTLEHFQP